MMSAAGVRPTLRFPHRRRGGPVASPSRAHLELPALVPALEARLERMLGQIMDLIRLETPSADLKALDAGADLVAHIGAKGLGGAPGRGPGHGAHPPGGRVGR